MTAVWVQPSLNGLAYRVTSAYDPEVVALIKSLPQRARRFDKVAGCWRVKASHIAALINLLVINGHQVIGGRVAAGAVDTVTDHTRDGAVLLGETEWPGGTQ